MSDVSIPKRPDVSVKLILRCDDSVLMLRRTDGSYEFPGGRIEWGESPEAALRRELLEELSYGIPGAPLFHHIYNYVSSDKSRHSIILHYLLEIDSHPQLHTTSEEPDAIVAWVDKEQLRNMTNDTPFVEGIFTR